MRPNGRTSEIRSLCCCRVEHKSGRIHRLLLASLVMSDLFTYLRAVGRHWMVGVTGGAIAVGLMLTIFYPLPKNIIGAALVGYVLVAGFYAWRDQYRATLDRPIEKRERMDALLATGEAFFRQKKVTLVNKWRT